MFCVERVISGWGMLLPPWKLQMISFKMLFMSLTEKREVGERNTYETIFIFSKHQRKTVTLVIKFMISWFMPIACIMLYCAIYSFFSLTAVFHMSKCLWTSKRIFTSFNLFTKYLNIFVWRVLHIEENLQYLIYINANIWSNYFHVFLILGLKDDLTVMFHPQISRHNYEII